jgi:hypothetical protein
MKRIACGAAVMLAGIFAVGGGCDDTSAPPPHLVADQPAAKPVEAEPTRPTTQELLQGPRKPVSLGDLPLTVRAPGGWALKTLANTTHVLLEGPTPSGEATIQLNVRPVINAQKLEMIVNGAKKELEQFPKSIKMVELRQITGAQVLERQRVGEMPRALPDDDPNVKPSRPFNWTITVFVARGAKHDAYELNFVGLTENQYEMDKPLLRGIIDSITVQSAADAAPASAPAAASAVPSAVR